MRVKYYILELVLCAFLVSCSLANKHDKSAENLSDNPNSFTVNTPKPEGNGVTIGGIIKITKVYPPSIDFKEDTLVSVYGSNFTANMKVTIAGFLCKDLNVKNSDEVSCLLPKVTDAPIPHNEKIVLQVTTLWGDSADFIMEETDYDFDVDGILDENDNCPQVYNPNQEPGGQDWQGGDACDPHDLDSDSVKDDVDNCPDIPNTDQKDSNGDGAGDACEFYDGDQDGIIDADDNCHEFNPDQKDSDDNGVGDVCEVF